MNTPVKPGAAAVDPVIVEIIRNGLFAVTEEMKTNLMRTAYNLIIYEALDFTVGLFTKEGDTVSIGLGLPMFIRGMSETVKSKIRHFWVRQHSPRRHSGHQRRLHHRQPPEPLHLHHAGVSRGRADWLHVLHGPLARRGWQPGADHDGYLLGRHSDPHRQVPKRGQSQPGPGGHHCHECSLARTGAGRFASANYRCHHG